MVCKPLEFLFGSIDSSSNELRDCILGLLFLKRISDVFDEEVERIEMEAGDGILARNDPDEHQFLVPKRARWDGIKGTPVQVGAELNRACVELEDANPVLAGVLTTIDFNSDRLGDARQRDVVLLKLIQQFSTIPMKNADLEEPDLIGRVFESLVGKFADNAGPKGGEFCTPPKVGQLLVCLADPQAGMRICNPTAGSGDILIEAARYLKRMGANPKDLTICGQVEDVAIWRICKMNMILHGFPDADIRRGDIIRDPKFVEGRQLLLFDRQIANLPFSAEDWGREEAEQDRFQRFRYGIPPRSRGDLAFVEHMISTLNDEGKMAAVVHPGVLFRGGSEGRIRKNILNEEILEAIIGLPSALSFGIGTPAVVLVINKKKPSERIGSVLFIDASREHQEDRKMKMEMKMETITDQEVEKIVAAHRGYEDVEKYCRVVPMAEIKENGYSLNISRYVDVAPEEEPVDVTAVLRDIRVIESRRQDLEADMIGYLKELGC